MVIILHTASSHDSSKVERAKVEFYVPASPIATESLHIMIVCMIALVIGGGDS